MNRIFISYKRSDKEKVNAIRNKIERSINETCWIDVEGIESDAQFISVIMSAIERSEVVLFMYSKSHSEITDFDSDWTIRELTYANTLKKRIVFINIDGSPFVGWFQFMYGTKLQVDGTSDSSIYHLIADLKRWLKPIVTDQPLEQSAPKEDVKVEESAPKRELKQEEFEAEFQALINTKNYVEAFALCHQAKDTPFGDSVKEKAEKLVIPHLRDRLKIPQHKVSVHHIIYALRGRFKKVEVDDFNIKMGSALLTVNQMNGDSTISGRCTKSTTSLVFKVILLINIAMPFYYNVLEGFLEEILDGCIADANQLADYCENIAAIITTIFVAMVVCWYRAIYKMRRKLIKLLAKDFLKSD
ncbi:MAG: toll/interleukin-1 receptor domain-containing protein [Lepagella sp.]